MQQLQSTRHRFARETRGEPMLILGREVTPIGKVTQVAGPGGGRLIHRPLAVEISQKGVTQRYPLPNARRYMLALLLLDLLMVALVLGVRRWLVLERSAS